jgi:hypothetical protein
VGGGAAVPFQRRVLAGLGGSHHQAARNLSGDRGRRRELCDLNKRVGHGEMSFWITVGAVLVEGHHLHR